MTCYATDLSVRKATRHDANKSAGVTGPATLLVSTRLGPPHCGRGKPPADARSAKPPRSTIRRNGVKESLPCSVALWGLTRPNWAGSNGALWAVAGDAVDDG